MIETLLYITFIDMDDAPSSGSSVRPQKMLEAFQQIGVEVVLLSGQNNQIKERRRNIRRIIRILRTKRPDYCYIEPPSGPMFCQTDIKLIKELYHKGIPIGLFYRDAYWKYPEYFMDNNASLKDRIKQKIIRSMQVRQLQVFEKCCRILYFPSNSMAKMFSVLRKDVLPPGCFFPNGVNPKDIISEKPVFIFVGGAAINHGTLLTLDAFKRANKEQTRAKLIYICPENQWKAMGLEEEKQKCKEWLTVLHLSGDEQLEKEYEKADVALLTAPRTAYRDFAVPIKIYEYISYLKPILVTNCTETAKIIQDNDVGWVTEDKAEEIAEQILELADNPEMIYEKKKNLFKARENNLWRVRAEKVISDLKENRL